MHFACITTNNWSPHVCLWTAVLPLRVSTPCGEKAFSMLAPPSSSSALHNVQPVPQITPQPFRPIGNRSKDRYFALKLAERRLIFVLEPIFS